MSTEPVPRPSVIPMLSYQNAQTALDWLAEAFGFVEVTRMLDDDGIVIHAEMVAGGGLIMLATPTPDYESPAHHREHCEAARTWLQAPYVIDGVLVEVADVDAHFRKAGRGGNHTGRAGGQPVRSHVSRGGSRGPPMDVSRPSELTVHASGRGSGGVSGGSGVGSCGSRPRSATPPPIRARGSER